MNQPRACQDLTAKEEQAKGFFSSLFSKLTKVSFTYLSVAKVEIYIILLESEYTYSAYQFLIFNVTTKVS